MTLTIEILNVQHQQSVQDKGRTIAWPRSTFLPLVLTPPSLRYGHGMGVFPREEAIHKMATAKLEKVTDDFLTCVVCHEIFSDPCTLSCQHSFCRKCITDYTKTKEEAIDNNVIICPSCRQMTKVPDPSKTVDQWAQQFKPGIVIVGLMDTMDYSDDKGDDEHCGLCEKIGEIIKAVLWCRQCGTSLCQRCVKIHGNHQALCRHELVNLDKKGQCLKNRNVICKEHDGEELKLHCSDCDIPICPLCAALYHRQCDQVVTIASMVDVMRSELSQVRNKLSKREAMDRKYVASCRGKIKEIEKNRDGALSQIQTVCLQLRKCVMVIEKQLSNQLGEITKDEINHMNAGVKTGEIEVQTLGQFMEYFKQIIDSNSEIDIYDTYHSYRAGHLMVDTDDSERKAPSTMSIAMRKNDEILPIIKGFLEKRLKFELLYPPSQFTSKLYGKFDFAMKRDTKVPNLQDILVLHVDGKDTIIVTDIDNDCVKAFTFMEGEPIKNKLVLESWPWGLAYMTDTLVLVAVPGNHEISTLELTQHQLNLVSSVKTDREYYSVAVLSPDTLVAGGDFCLDVLDMEGVRLRSMSSDGLFKYPWYMCVSYCHLFVSDSLRKTVTCLTLEGDFEWEYSSTEEGELVDPRGVSVTSDQDIIIADNELQKVFKVSKSGHFVKDVVGREEGIALPRGVLDNGYGSVFVCEENVIKEFLLDT